MMVILGGACQLYKSIQTFMYRIKPTKIFPTYHDGYIDRNLPVIQEDSNLYVLDKFQKDNCHNKCQEFVGEATQLVLKIL